MFTSQFNSKSFPLYYHNITVTDDSQIPKIKFSSKGKGKGTRKVVIRIKTFLVAYALFFSLLCTSQVNESYMTHINLAENHITNNLFNEALHEYNLAFKFRTYPFPKDIHNQIRCAIYCKEDTEVTKSLLFLMENYLIEPRYFKKYRKYLNSQEKKDYSIRYKAYSNKRHIIDSLLKVDQEIRTSYNYLHAYDKIRKVDSLSFEVFKSKLIPSNIDPSTFFLFFKKMDFQPDIKSYVLVRHWFQQKLMGVEEIFFELTINGYFPPEVFADLVDLKSGHMMYKSKYGMETEIKYGRHVKQIKRSYEDIESINENRKVIGLPDYTTYIKNMEFFKSHKKFLYYNLKVLNFSGNKSFKSFFDSL